MRGRGGVLVSPSCSIWGTRDCRAITLGERKDREGVVHENGISVGMYSTLIRKVRELAITEEQRVFSLIVGKTAVIQIMAGEIDISL